MPVFSRGMSEGHGVLPEDFTLRAVLGGIAVGTLLMWSNLYFGLLSAWITMASLQAALVGYAIFRFVPGLSSTTSEPPQTGRWSRPFTSQENAVLQATAVSLGAMPLCAGLIGIVPAFNLLKPEKDGEGVHPFTFSWQSLLLWCAAMAFFGIFFASPMRSPMILQEKLRFPSGSATAQLIALLHGTSIRKDDGDDRDDHSTTQTTRIYDNTDAEQRPLLSRQTSRQMAEEDVEQGWKSLVVCFAASASITVASFCFPVIFAIPIFDPFLGGHDAASRWGWWFTPSLSYIGQGIIMGPHTTISMFFGTIVGWAVLSPLANKLGWTNGIPMDAEEGSKAWILWVSLAIMTSESIVGLMTLTWSQFATTSTPTTVDEDGGVQNGASVASFPTDTQYEPPWRLTPTSWIVWGLLLSTVASTLLLPMIFGRGDETTIQVKVWVPLVGIVIAAALSVLAVRALGATDLNPVNALGKLSQLAFAILQPGNIIANMIGGALSEAGAMQAGELMQDYKTGHLVQASPRGQFLGQLVGSTVGIFASTAAYKLYERSYQLPGPDMPAPAARLWLNFARLINKGSLPPKSSLAMAISAILFSLLTFVKTYLETHPNSHYSHKYRKFLILLPNGIAFAVGLGLNTPNFSLARLIGGLIVIYYNRKAPKRQSSSSSLPPVKLLIWSAGFVLGEGFSSILILLFKELGLSAISCFGCRGGCSAGCSA